MLLNMTKKVSSLVSIIIPCYQQEAYIADAINSALDQSHSAVEVIVVNDGSTDSSGNIARSYGDQIKYIEKENEGVSKTRNRGVTESRGEYLIFLDGDDLLSPRAVELHLMGMKNHSNRITVLAHQELGNESEGNEVNSDPRFVYESPLPGLLFRNYGPPVKFMCSRKSFDASGGFLLHSWGCEDWNLWVNIALNGADIAVSPEIGAYYRRGEEMRSSNYRAMLEAKCDHFRQIHNRIISTEPLRGKLGGQLVDAQENLLKVLIAHHMPTQDIKQVGNQVRDFHRMGIRGQNSTATQRFLGWCFGTEWAARLTLFKWWLTDRSLYQHYKKQDRSPV